MAGEIIVLQHVEPETLGTIEEALNGHGLTARYLRGDQGATIPAHLGRAAGLVIMGGPMGVYEEDRYPFLRAEMELIKQTLREGKPILGVCLGSQLLAAAVGGRVYPGKKKEIGWQPVTLAAEAGNDPVWGQAYKRLQGTAKADESGMPRFMGYHWHGDVFDLPPEAVRLASSELTACQAFRFGPAAYGILFHMEVTSKIMTGMVDTFAEELASVHIDRRDILDPAETYLPALTAIGQEVYGRWAQLCKQTG